MQSSMIMCVLQYEVTVYSVLRKISKGFLVRFLSYMNIYVCIWKHRY